jgi:hypothetical protein
VNQFKEKSELHMSMTQIKDKYETMRKPFIDLDYLYVEMQVQLKSNYKAITFLNNLSGLGWDPEKKCVKTTAEVWDGLQEVSRFIILYYYDHQQSSGIQKEVQQMARDGLQEVSRFIILYYYDHQQSSGIQKEVQQMARKTLSSISKSESFVRGQGGHWCKCRLDSSNGGECQSRRSPRNTSLSRQRANGMS